MCGIVGYTGTKNAADILLDGLSHLEYRGYDSAGISLLRGGGIDTIKAKGRLQILADTIKKNGDFAGHCGVGHTRWATHGAPSDINSHPHNTAKLSLVHNGIIENYLEIKAFLTDKGYRFTSETDTETAAKLIDYFYDGDAFDAISRALAMLVGSYAFGILFAAEPDTIYAVRKDSPLIIGLGSAGENYIASDIPAILAHTRRYHLLEEGEIAVIKPDAVVVYDAAKAPIAKDILTADWDIAQAEKGGYPHFMLKEIHEQPKALHDTLHPRIKNNLPDFAIDNIPADFFSRYQALHIVACGSASYVGAVGKNLIEKLARIPVQVELASEFRYGAPILTDKSLVIIISQSGETADTLAALRLAKAEGAATLAIVNVTGSSIAREADYVLYTFAGPEIAVATTKAFSVQVGVMYLLAISFALAAGKMDTTRAQTLTEQLLTTAGLVRQVLPLSDEIAALAQEFLLQEDLFYLGRGVDYAMAMEGSLKLKEISYIHSEACPAGELKHGPISLITENMPVIALMTQQELLSKTASNVKETRARGSRVLVIAGASCAVDADIYDNIIRLPQTDDLFAPMLSVVAMQLLAYHVAVGKGCDVDKPRNLAKSVTVE